VAKPRIYFAISLRSVNSIACGSKVKEQLQKWHRKGIAASQRTRPPKDCSKKLHKHSPNTQGHLL